MPKVTDEYLIEKKNQIMDIALEIMRDKPLYEITMRDIIRKLGCSQGLIYRYYKSVDEIYVDVMNREIGDIDFNGKISEIFNNMMKPDEKIKNAFSCLGKYIEEVQQKIGGKFYYEIQVGYTFDMEKRELLLPKLILKQNMNFFRLEIMKFISENIRNGIFKPRISVETLAAYTGIVIDGIGNDMAIIGSGQNREMFELLSAYVIDSLGMEEK